MQVYMIEWLSVKRDSVLLDPERDVVKEVIAGFYEDEIARWVHSYFHGQTTIFGITREFARLFVMREFLKLHHVVKFPLGTSLAGAKINFIKFMSLRAAAVGWVAIGLVAAAVVLGVIFAIQDWTEKSAGRIYFPWGSCILRYKNRLWWGGVTGRPYADRWDFYRCSEIGDVFLYENRMSGSGYWGIDWWDFLGVWEFKEKKLIGWYVYRVEEMRLRYLGLAHSRGFGRYRLQLPDGAQQPYDEPVGWGIKEYDVCKYVGNYSDYFQ